MRKYLDNGLWLLALLAGGCTVLFVLLTAILIVARVIAWAWGW